MTTQELTGSNPQVLRTYVRAIYDGWLRANSIDERKELSIRCWLPCPYDGDVKIEFAYVSEIHEAPYRLHDRHDRGNITVFDPKPIASTDHIRWHPKEGTGALWDKIEQMIDRINKIEL